MTQRFWQHVVSMLALLVMLGCFLVAYEALKCGDVMLTAYCSMLIGSNYAIICVMNRNIGRNEQ